MRVCHLSGERASRIFDPSIGDRSPRGDVTVLSELWADIEARLSERRRSSTVRWPRRARNVGNDRVRCVLVGCATR